MQEGFIGHNDKIKKALILIPMILIVSTAIIMSIINVVLANNYEGSTLYLSILIATVIISALFSFTIINIMKNKFITKLDKLDNGLFGFLDYLEGNSKTLVKIDEGVGEMSDAINEKINLIYKRLRENEKFLEELKSVVEAVEKGDFSKSVETLPPDKTLQKIQTQINDMITSLQNNIGSDLTAILNTLQSYTDEDYTKEISSPNGNVEKAINNLKRTIVKILISSRNFGQLFHDRANKVNSKVNQAYENIDINLTRELAKINYALDEVTKHIKANVESASFIHSATDQVTKAAKEGEILAQKTSKSMNEISQEVDKINEAISIIDQITMQTNILSLNAAVEASTAGEAGKGFAVVASEVRNLASQTQAASKDIQAVVDIAKEKAAIGNEISRKMIDGYHHLVRSVEQSISLIHDITKNSNLQDDEINKIHNLMKNMQELISTSLVELEEANNLSNQNRENAKKIIEFTESKKFIEV